MLDFLLTDALLVDGSGKNPYYANLGIKDGKLKIPVRKDANAVTKIDAQGLFIAPGFIDIHAHSDLTLLVEPEASSKLYQGVTTEVVGNCGFSAAPLRGAAVKRVKKDLASYNMELEWHNFSDYLNALAERDLGPNVLSYVGHGILREGIIGSQNRQANTKELEEMKVMLAQAMESGAIGISSGLAYPPSCYANKFELIELAKVVAYYGGVYAVHLRNEREGIIDATKEMLDVAKESGVNLEISHHKVLGENNQGLIDETLSMIKGAREDGLNVDCDIYPYTAAATTLASLLPKWLFEGGQELFLSRLKEQKELIIQILNSKYPSNYGAKLFILTGEQQGKSVKELALENEQSWAKKVVEIILAERFSPSVLKFAIAPEVINKVLQTEFSLIASDAAARKRDTILSRSFCHPRAYGAFSKVINHHVKRKILSLPEAIKKMTYLPAQKLNLKRGLIKDGYPADLVVFALAEFKDTATYQNPHSYSKGIKHLFINGQQVIKAGKRTKNQGSGQVIKLNRK